MATKLQASTVRACRSLSWSGLAGRIMQQACRTQTAGQQRNSPQLAARSSLRNTRSRNYSSSTVSATGTTISRKHAPDFQPPTPADLAELRTTVHDFCKRHIPEEVAAAVDSKNDFPADIWQKLGEAGFLGITAPSAYGGMDMGYQAHAVVMEELSRASGSIALSYAAHSQLCVNQICLNGSDEQKARYLPDLISGRKVGALAMSETGAGSDVVSMQTKATETGDGFVLDGSKMWITNGPDADLIVVYAKTSPPPTQPSKAITAFLVEPETSTGFSVARKLDKLGMRGSNTGELHFDGVLVPKANMLGRLNGGVRVLMEGLDLERLVLSAGPLGLMRRALDEALPYVHTRRQFDQPLARNQLVQAKLADMYTAYRAAAALTHEVARSIDTSHDDPASNYGISSRDCTAAILFAAEQATRVCLDAVQLLGGMGYMSEVPVGRLVRDAKLYEIGAGTSEVRRIVVGRSFEREYGGA